MSKLPRDNRAYRRRAAALKKKAQRHNWPCWICGEPFDFSLDWRDSMSFTADHVDPIAKGGHVLGVLKPAHRGCNARRGKGDYEDKVPTTRRW